MEISPVSSSRRTRKVQSAAVPEPKSGSKSGKATAVAKAAPEVTKVKRKPAHLKAGSKAGAAQPKSSRTKPQAALLQSSAADVRAMIATAAYYLAEQRSFAPGHELQDWLQAERLILGPQVR